MKTLQILIDLFFHLIQLINRKNKKSYHAKNNQLSVGIRIIEFIKVNNDGYCVT